jgi:hypothetical protein
MSLPCLTVEEIILLIAERDAIARAKLVKSLEDAGVDAETKLRELKQFDRYSGNISELSVYAQTTEGAFRVVTMAAKRAGVAVPILDPSGALIVEAFRLLGWDLEKLAAKAADADPTASQSPSSGTG